MRYTNIMYFNFNIFSNMLLLFDNKYLNIKYSGVSTPAITLQSLVLYPEMESIAQF